MTKAKFKTPEEMCDMRDKIARDCAKASNLKARSVGKVMAQRFAELAVLHEQLWMEKITGQGSPEETRTLPAIASNMKRLLDTLGIAGDFTEDDADL